MRFSGAFKTIREPKTKKDWDLFLDPVYEIIKDAEKNNKDIDDLGYVLRNSEPLGLSTHETIYILKLLEDDAMFQAGEGTYYRFKT